MDGFDQIRITGFAVAVFLSLMAQLPAVRSLRWWFYASSMGLLAAMAQWMADAPGRMASFAFLCFCAQVGCTASGLLWQSGKLKYLRTAFAASVLTGFALLTVLGKSAQQLAAARSVILLGLLLALVSYLAWRRDRRPWTASILSALLMLGILHQLLKIAEAMHWSDPAFLPLLSRAGGVIGPIAVSAALIFIALHDLAVQDEQLRQRAGHMRQLVDTTDHAICEIERRGAGGSCRSSGRLRLPPRRHRRWRQRRTSGSLSRLFAVIAMRGSAASCKTSAASGNLTAIPAGASAEQVTAFDTGPGQHGDAMPPSPTACSAEPYDRDGASRRRGVAHRAKSLAALLRPPFFHRPPPKTAGREQFGREFAQRFLKICGRAHKPDVIATATALTARSIADAIRHFVLPRRGKFREFVVSGGGADNSTLLAMLANEFRPLHLTIRVSDEFGLPSEAKEAAAFALMAYETWNHRPSNIPSATGAKRPAILGKISYA